MLEQGPFDSVQLRRWVDQVQQGDKTMPDKLIQHVCSQLERLVRKMLRGDPRVHRWEQTGDVLQGSFMRLLRALKEVTPKSRKDFFALATLQIRRELLDLARHYYGPQGEGANHASVAAKTPGGEIVDFQPADSSIDPARLAEWTEFHRQVEKLPDKERGVFELRYYQGLKFKEVAEVLGIDVSTAERQFRSALISLSVVLRGQRPDID